MVQAVIPSFFIVRDTLNVWPGKTPLGAELLDAARASFVDAFEWAASISAAVVVALAIAAVVWLRRPHGE